MKIILSPVAAILLLPPSSPAAAPPAKIRTLKDLPGFPLQALSQSINHQLLRSLEVSPLEAWIVARSPVFGGKSQVAKIIHEEGDGRYDELIKELARNYEVTGGEHTESRIGGESLTYHLLIFDIKDGKMGIMVPHSNEARYLGFQQSNEIWMGLLKNGTWTKMSKPHQR